LPKEIGEYIVDHTTTIVTQGEEGSADLVRTKENEPIVTVPCSETPRDFDGNRVGQGSNDSAPKYLSFESLELFEE